jgi:hypothetical protein
MYVNAKMLTVETIQGMVRRGGIKESRERG